MLGMIHVTSLSVIGSGKVILSCMSNVFVWNWTAFSFRFIAAENGRLVTLERLVSVSVKEEKEKENEWKLEYKLGNLRLLVFFGVPPISTPFLMSPDLRGLLDWAATEQTFYGNSSASNATVHY
jgi:hypothetical protein